MRSLFWLITLCALVWTACQKDKDRPGSNDYVACTLDAKIVCVVTDSGTFEQAMTGRRAPECEFEPLPNEVDMANCEACEEQRPAEADVDAAIEEAAACTEDSDCEIYFPRASGCKGLCGLLVGRDADKERLKHLLDAFGACGPDCAVQCAERHADALTCVDSRCAEPLPPCKMLR